MQKFLNNAAQLACRQFEIELKRNYEIDFYCVVTEYIRPQTYVVYVNVII